MIFVRGDIVEFENGTLGMAIDDDFLLVLSRPSEIFHLAVISVSTASIKQKIGHIKEIIFQDKDGKHGWAWQNE